MISDEQRREAAASLRGSRGFFNSLPRTVLEPFIFDIFERVLECVGYTEGNVFDYLADLVDRGECENVYDGERPGLVRQRLPVLGLRLQGRGRGALPRERRLELLPAVREEGAAWLTR